MDFLQPTSWDDALAAKAARPEAVPIAGGTDVMVEINFDARRPAAMLDLTRVPDLARWTSEAGRVRLGAAVSYARVIGELGDRLPGLAMAARTVGSPQIRNRGTVGGSLAHADPAAELPCIAVTCEASIVVRGEGGQRTIAAADFFRGPLLTALQTDEIITEIRLPAWPARRHFGFCEFARRRGDFALAGVAAFYDANDNKATNVHVGVLGVADRPLRLRAVEKVLDGQPVDDATIARAEAAASAAIDPPDDIHATGAYRKVLIGVMVERALHSAL